MAIEDFLNPMVRGPQPTANPQENPNMLLDIAAAPLRGVEGAFQGLYDLADFATGDNLLPDYDQRLLGRSQTFAGTMVEGVSQFLTGFVPIAGQLSKVSKLSKVGKMGRRRLNTAGYAVGGAVADATVFQSQEERLSNLIQSFPELQNPVTDYLAADGDDSELEGRFKNAVEGLALGGLADSLFAGVRLLKRGRKGDDPNQAMEEYESIAYNKQRDDALLGADFSNTSMLRQNLEQNLKDKGINIDLANDGLTGKELLETLRSDYNGLYDTLIDTLLDKGGQSLENTRVFFKPTNNQFSAYYDSVNNQIVMERGGVRTMMHELIHAVTVKEINTKTSELFSESYPRIGELKPTPNQPSFPSRFVSDSKNILEEIAKGDSAVAGLYRSYLTVIKALGKEADVFDTGAKSINKEIYGLSNLEEFVAEAFTNPEFRRVLKNIPSEGGKQTSMFDDFLEAVKRLLGLDSSTSSILDDIVKNTDDVIRDQETRFDSHFAHLKEMDDMVLGQRRTLDDRGEDFEGFDKKDRISETQTDNMIPTRGETEESYLFPIGKKFNGFPIEEVPTGYLKNVMTWKSVGNDVKTRIEQELNARESGKASGPERDMTPAEYIEARREAEANLANRGSANRRKFKAARAVMERGPNRIESDMTMEEFRSQGSAKTPLEMYERYRRSREGGKGNSRMESFQEYMANRMLEPTHTAVYKGGTQVGSKETDAFTSAKFRREAASYARKYDGFRLARKKRGLPQIEEAGESIAPKIDLSGSGKSGRYFEKDQKKFALADKLISRGSPKSSSEAYRKAAGDKANTGLYEDGDIVGISAEGNRNNRVAPDFDEINKAAEKDVIFLTDVKADRNRSYNIGEREVVEHLESLGFKEIGDGKWRKPVEGESIAPKPTRNIERADRISPELLKANPDKVYLFGDNLMGTGKGGQAIVRDEPNAIGIPTKKAPRRTDDAYFSDDEFQSNKIAIDDAFDQIPEGKTVVIPSDGLGTGLAKLEEKAPKTFDYLQQKLKDLEVAPEVLGQRGFYSNVEKAADTVFTRHMDDTKGSANAAKEINFERLKKMLIKQGDAGTQEELEFRGFDEYFRGAKDKDKISREDFDEFLKDTEFNFEFEPVNGLTTQEARMLSEAESAGQDFGAGEIAERAHARMEAINDERMRQPGLHTNPQNYALRDVEDYIGVNNTEFLNQKLQSRAAAHFGEDVIYHVRTTDRELNGNKVLYVEEIQSDLHSAARKDQAEKSPNVDKKKIPFMQKGFHNNAARQLIKKAVEEGYDAIWLPSGSQIQQLYSKNYKYGFYDKTYRDAFEKAAKNLDPKYTKLSPIKGPKNPFKNARDAQDYIDTFGREAYMERIGVPTEDFIRYDNPLDEDPRWDNIDLDDGVSSKGKRLLGPFEGGVGFKISNEMKAKAQVDSPIFGQRDLYLGLERERANSPEQLKALDEIADLRGELTELLVKGDISDDIGVDAHIESMALPLDAPKVEAEKGKDYGKYVALKEQIRKLEEAYVTKYGSSDSDEVLGQRDLDEALNDSIDRLAANLKTGGTQAILSAARNIRTTTQALGLIQAIAKNLDETGTKTTTNVEELTAETEELVGELGGNPENYANIVRRVEKEGIDLQGFRNSQRAVKSLIDVMSSNVIDLANKAYEARTNSSIPKDVAEAEMLDALDQLSEVQRIWSLMGREAGLTLVQRKFLGNSGGTYRVNKKVGLDTQRARRNELDKYVRGNTGGMGIDKLVDALRKSKNPEDAKAQLKSVLETNKEVKGSKLMDVTMEYYMNSLLSGPTTQIVNILGNSLTMALRTLELAAGGLMSGDPALTKAVLKHAFDADMLKDSFSMAVDTFKKDENTLTQGSRALDDRYQNTRAIEAEGEGAFAESINTLGTVVRLPSRALASGDEFFKQLNYRQYVKMNLAYEGLTKHGIKDGKELAKYVVSNFDKFITQGGRAYNEQGIYLDAVAASEKAGLKAGTAQDEFIEKYLKENAFDESRGGVADAALNYAEVGTFTNDLSKDGIIGPISNSLSHLKHKGPYWQSLNFVIPFLRTPTNILSFALDRTPISVVGDAFNLMRRRDDATLELNSDDPFVRAQARGKVATSVAVTSAALWYTMSNKEFITGKGPSTPEEREVLEKSGWRPYSIKVGDTYVSYARLDPAATIIGLFADMVEAHEYHDFSDNTIQDMFSMVALSLQNNITHKSYLKGLDSLLNFVKDPVKNAEAFGGNIVGGFAPTLFSQLQNAGDERALRETRNVFDHFIKRTPLAGTLPVKRNFLGEPIINKTAAFGVKGTGMINPFYFAQESKDPVDRELASLKHGFSMPDSKMYDAIELTDVFNEDGRQAYDRWLELTSTTKIGGKTLKEALRQMVKDKGYQSMPRESREDIGLDSPRIKAIRKIVGAYRRKGRAEMISEFPDLQSSIDELQQGREQYRLIQ